MADQQPVENTVGDVRPARVVVQGQRTLSVFHVPPCTFAHHAPCNMHGIAKVPGFGMHAEYPPARAILSQPTVAHKSFTLELSGQTHFLKYLNCL